MILAIDPGETIGFAAHDHYGYNSWQIDFSVAPRRHLAFYESMRLVSPDIIAYEEFRLRNAKTGVQYAPIEYIGIIELFAEAKDIEIYHYSSSQAKAFWTNDNIKKMGLWKPSKPHAMDALRILMTYQYLNDQIDLTMLKQL